MPSQASRLDGDCGAASPSGEVEVGGVKTGWFWSGTHRISSLGVREFREEESGFGSVNSKLNLILFQLLTTHYCRFRSLLVFHVSLLCW